MFKSTAVRRVVPRFVDEGRTHIQLRELPRSAVLTDLRRLCIRNKLLGVTDIAIDYHRFLPTGRAYLALAHTKHLQKNLQALDKASVGSLPIKAVSAPPPRSGHGLDKTRTERKVFSGNGPHGGISSRLKHVVIWGFPGKISEEAVENYLRDFRLDNIDNKTGAVKVELTANTFSLYSRYLVRPTSIAEAHRLVRKLHMTYYEPEHWAKRYQLRARVVY
ncbi:uncharacterized protein EDB93DRAFT_661068 [Suillus bovinus]|uniref:uncharacterized protein n=1 Tax=Suillus bovinus TaxID=48563 RepID=UPI001B86EE41|nr:uncharacterized protein EDB93DRAFT_661068 [Suillus bovinus]KAG2158340.1 hypothetical protein EDB93DRAFT_661068 [Suillus bovinus]